MCPTCSEAKHTEKLETGAEKGLLQGRERRHSFSCLKKFSAPQRMLVAQPCLTLWDPMDCGPPGPSVHGFLQARILKWVTIPSPGDLPDPGIEPRSPALPTDSFLSEPPRAPQRVSAKRS